MWRGQVVSATGLNRPEGFELRELPSQFPGNQKIRRRGRRAQSGWEPQPMIALALACPGLRSGVVPHLVRWRAKLVPRRSEALVTATEGQAQTSVVKLFPTTNLRGRRRNSTLVGHCVNTVTYSSRLPREDPEDPTRSSFAKHAKIAIGSSFLLCVSVVQFLSRRCATEFRKSTGFQRA